MMQGELKVFYSEDASKDLFEAVKYYNRINFTLGKRPKTEIKNAEQKIKSNPAFASIKYLNINTVACTFFPYPIHYEVNVDLNRIIIISIFHFSKERNK